MKNNKIIFISQPVQIGQSERKIIEMRRKAVDYLTRKGFSVKNPDFIKSEELIGNSIYALANSISQIAECDGVYFCKGWNKARICRIENEAAVKYGLICLYENRKDG